MRLSRRTFAASALGACLLPFRATANQWSDANPRRTRPQRSLLVGQPSMSGFIETVGVFEPGGTLLDTIAVPAGVVSAIPSPDPQRVNLSCLIGSAQLDLATLAVTKLTVEGDDGSLLFPSPAVTGPASSGDRFMVLPTFTFSGVYLYDLIAAEARAITEWVVGPDQPFIPASATFAPSGTVAGIWTGNNVHLLDVTQPERAVPLNGHNPALYSTGFAITPDEKWVAYTTYDPADGNGQVLWQDVESGDLLPVVDGTAWSIVDLIVGDPDHFLLFHDGQVERRPLADPSAAGDVFGSIGAQPLGASLGTADGRHRLVASRRSATAPARWQWLDLDAGTLRDLIDLDGLECRNLTPWKQDPRYLVFGGAMDEFGEPRVAPVIGLDLVSGETFVLLDEVVLDTMVRHTTTHDGSLMLITSYPEADGAGTWLFDLANRTVEQFPLAAEGGAITPAGDLAALSVPSGSGSEPVVLLFDPRAPSAYQSLGKGAVLGWS